MPEQRDLPEWESRNTESINTDDISVTRLLLRHWLALILTTLVSAGLGLGATFVLPQWFESTVNIVPINTNSNPLSSALSGVSSTLKEFGLGKLTGGSADGYTYMAILTSRSFQDSLIKRFDLATEYNLPTSKMDDIREEFQDNHQIQLSEEGNYTITFFSKDPRKAAEMANASVPIANHLASAIRKGEASYNRVFMEKRLLGVDSMLTKVSDSLQRFSRQAGVYSPMDQAKALASSLGELKAAKMKQEISYELLRRSYGEQDASTIAQKRILDEISTQLQMAETQPGFAGNFAVTDAMSVGVGFARLYSEFEALSKVRVFLMPMLEQARLDEAKEAPAMVVLDEAVPATKKSRPKRAVYTAGAALTGILLFVFFVVAQDRFGKTARALVKQA